MIGNLNRILLSSCARKILKSVYLRVWLLTAPDPRWIVLKRSAQTHAIGLIMFNMDSAVSTKHAVKRKSKQITVPTAICKMIFAINDQKCNKGKNEPKYDHYISVLSAVKIHSTLTFQFCYPPWKSSQLTDAVTCHDSWWRQWAGWISLNRQLTNTDTNLTL